MDSWNLDDSVIEAYIKGFYGHGRYESRYWYIGMEAGGGRTESEVISRIQGWHNHGRPELEALGGSARWFRDPAALQPTWKHLIRITLNAEGLPAQREDIRAYQKARLGREDGLECILELLPLPSPGVGKWLFYPKSGLDYLSDRATYTGYVTPGRIEHLRTRIAEHRPGVVTFYGRKYENEWRAISGVDFRPARIINVSTARNDHTLFITMPHPTAYGLTNAYFDAIGQLIAADLKR
jgi:hypothetical protein